MSQLTLFLGCVFWSTRACEITYHSPTSTVVFLITQGATKLRVCLTHNTFPVNDFWLRLNSFSLHAQWSCDNKSDICIKIKSEILNRVLVIRKVNYVFVHMVMCSNNGCCRRQQFHLPSYIAKNYQRSANRLAD